MDKIAFWKLVFVSWLHKLWVTTISTTPLRYTTPRFFKPLSALLFSVKSVLIAREAPLGNADSSFIIKGILPGAARRRRWCTENIWASDCRVFPISRARQPQRARAFLCLYIIFSFLIRKRAPRSFIRFIVNRGILPRAPWDPANDCTIFCYYINYMIMKCGHLEII